MTCHEMIARFRLGRTFCLAAALACCGATSAWGETLGPFEFEDTLFGDTLTESDSTLADTNWLSVANSDPGYPDYLIGDGAGVGLFGTGVGEIPNDVIYTIGYYTPILNGVGADLGVVVARFGTADVHDLTLAVSTNGVDFTSALELASSSAVDSESDASYFFGGGGPFSASRWVHSIDLSNFGLSIGQTIVAARVGQPNSDEDLNLLRVAGFSGVMVPEPASCGLAACGAAVLVCLALGGRRRYSHSLAPRC